MHVKLETPQQVLAALPFRGVHDKGGGRTLHFGGVLVMDGYDVNSLLGPHWQMFEPWADGRYRWVWLNPINKAVLTYCEGDLHLVTCNSWNAYYTEVAEAGQFYCTGEAV